MTDGERTTRRSLLTGTAVVLGGCLGASDSGQQPADDTEEPSGTDGADENEGTSGTTATAAADGTDGYPPELDERPEERSIDTSSFDTVTEDGTEVPLAPIDVAHYWFFRREARFADARGEFSYEESHILGAVSSPAPDGGDSDPVADWPKDDLIVCYCGCPHHLSSMRAATLIQNGYENVYVIDEGFWEWHDRGYPMAGEEVTEQPAVYEIRGRTADQYAGDSAWAWHERSGQREATGIDDQGQYLLELRFTDVSADSVVRVKTPAYEVRAPLGDLTADVVTGRDA